VSGKGKGTRDGKGRGYGKGKVNGKGLMNKPLGEMISLVTLICNCRRKGMMQTWTRRAK
jgi:hypothetical protein